MTSETNLRVVALAGGVGGAKMAHGLAQGLPASHLTVLVNVGDDFEHFGLKICPDLDTVCYTLAGLANPVTGWGIAEERWTVLETIRQLGGPVWFRLGDRDLATHLERTRRLRAGQPLSQITAEFCRAWGIAARVLPVSDDPIPTIVHTDEGDLAFQEYFVRRHCEPRVNGFTFRNVAASAPAPGVLDALEEADAIIFCPSNPFVSIDPILAVPGIREAIQHRRAKGCAIVAISPIIGGKAVKGPAAKMMTELGIEPSALSVARHYQGIINGFILDQEDVNLAAAIQATGVSVKISNTLIPQAADRLRFALEVLDFCMTIPCSAGGRE